MPSHLRLQSHFEPVIAHATYQLSPTTPPSKKPKMSLTQTYYIASTARSKLGREANKADHNLARLVGHANLLDNLMLELADAEKKQETWFAESVSKADKADQPKHIQWIDTIPEMDEEDSDDESDAGSEYDEDIEEYYNIPVRNFVAAPVQLESEEMMEEDEEDGEDDDEHALIRIPSNKQSPPELMEDASDSDSEDESMPPSPGSESFKLSEKQRQSITTTSFYDAKSSQQGLEDYIRQAQQQQQPLIAAC